VAATVLAALLLKSDQLPGLLESASRTSAQWSSVVAVAIAAVAELHPPWVPAVQAKHASHLCACSQTSVGITHIRSDSVVFQHKKRCVEDLHRTE
jgi:L-asparaginase II